MYVATFAGPHLVYGLASDWACRW